MNQAADLLVENRENATRLYSMVLQTSNMFLHNCRHFSIGMLREENPTYAEVAKIMKQLAGIISALADDFDPMMGQKAHEYCELMTHMGVAIEGDDRVRLVALVAELERKPCL